MRGALVLCEHPWGWQREQPGLHHVGLTEMMEMGWDGSGAAPGPCSGWVFGELVPCERCVAWKVCALCHQGQELGLGSALRSRSQPLTGVAGPSHALILQDWPLLHSQLTALSSGGPGFDLLLAKTGKMRVKIHLRT